jgi:cytochrome c
MRFLLLIFSLLVVFYWGCGGQSEPGSASGKAAPAKDQKNEFGLTEYEMTYGIGPIKERMFLGQINEALAKKGEAIFATKCSPCHKLDERYIGPAQRYATERRPPEYIMNMILNPDEMVKRHPEAKKLLAEYLSPMTFQNVTEADARMLLEYMRLAAKEGREKNIPEIPVFKNQTKKP